MSAIRFKVPLVFGMAVTLMVVGATAAGAQVDPVASPGDVGESLVLSSGKTLELPRAFEPDSVRPAPAEGGSFNLEELEGATKGYVIPEEYVDAVAGTFLSSESPDPERVEPPPSVLSIIGADDRRKVTDPRVAPFVQTPLILFKNGGSPYMCTGWLLGTYAVATAAHCLYASGGYSTDIQVVFGADGYNALAACTVDHTSVPAAWIAERSPDDDWGVIQINCNAGQVFGSFGYAIPPVGAGSSVLHSVTGYPGDKVNAVSGYTMWTSSGRIVNVAAKRVYYGIDTSGGQSGGPVWRNQAGCGNCVTAIHAYGVGGGGSNNSGTRITAAVFAFYSIYSAGWVNKA